MIPGLAACQTQKNAGYFSESMELKRLSSSIAKKNVKETQDFIFEHVCKLFDQDPVKVRENDDKRNREYVIVRQVTMCLFRLDMKLSLHESGAYFFLDHATVLHAIKTVSNLKDTDKNFREKTAYLFAGINFPITRRKI
jgi:chromosomal replication initiator protein